MDIIIKTIKDRNLFNDLTIETKVISQEKGISVSVGRLKDNDHKEVQAVLFSPHWNEKMINKWMERHVDDIKFTISLPDEAASLWLTEYDKATINGMSGHDASEHAWGEVKKKWYKDKDGAWHRLEKSWQKALSMSDMPAIEIFRAGKYPQGEFTEKDIDEMVSNFDKGIHTPPATNDHRQDGPALGWVSKLFRKGASLYAVLKDLTTEFTKKLKSGAYKNRSIEIYKNYKDENGQSHGMLLKAVSFLGAMAPQVKGMPEPQFYDHIKGVTFFSIDNPEWTGFPIDITDKYIRIQQHLPDGYSEMRTIQIPKGGGQGIKAIYGKIKGTDNWEIQSYLFDKEKWDLAKAKKWVKENGGKISASEPPNKGVELIQLTEEELEVKLKAREDTVKAKFNVDSDKQKDEMKKLSDENKALKEKQSTEDAKRKKEEALKLFDELAKKGKVLTTFKERVTFLFETLANDIEAKTKVDGKEVSAFDCLKSIFDKMPDVVKMEEISKEKDKLKNLPSTKDAQIREMATKESVELLDKIEEHLKEKGIKPGDENYKLEFKEAYSVLKKEKE